MNNLSPDWSHPEKPKGTARRQPAESLLWLPLAEATKLELAHLNEIFSTADALTGLSNVGKKGIAFEGR